MLDLLSLSIVLYRHLYRQKTSSLPGAGDALGLRGGYSSPSIVNHHQESREPLFLEPTITKPVAIGECLVRRSAPTIPSRLLTAFRAFTQMNLNKRSAATLVQISKLMTDVQQFVGSL